MSGSLGTNAKTIENWLVKSGDQVLGPFSSEQIGQKLLGREVAIIDEVCLPQGRWRLIRDEPHFASVVEEARKTLMNAREETEISGYTSTPMVPADSDFTPTPVAQTTHVSSNSSGQNAGLVGANAPVGQIRDAEFVETSSDETANSDSAESSSSFKQFGLRGRAKAGMSRQVIATWAIAGFVVIGALYMVFFNTKKVPEGRVVASLDFERSVASADRAWQRGDFGTAEKLYAQANRTKPLQLEVVTRLAPLMVQLDGQTVEAKRLLVDAQKANDPNANPRLFNEMQLGFALAHLYSGEYQDAETILKTAQSESSFVADFNLGMLAYMSQNFEEAAQQFARAGDAPIALFMRIRALASLPKKRGGRKEAGTLLATLTKTQYDFNQEAQLLSAALLLENGNKKGALARARMVLESDPEMTSNHWHDPLLFQTPANWKSLLGVCRRLNDGLKSNVTRGLLALCLGRAGNGEEAMRILNEGLASSGEDPLLQAVNAQLLYNSARDEDARAALRMALRREPVPVLARIVKARLCTRHNELACAEEEWKVLAAVNGPQKLAAQVGLAQIYAKRGDVADAQDLAAKALALSPRYKPALSLREGGSEK